MDQEAFKGIQKRVAAFAGEQRFNQQLIGTGDDGELALGLQHRAHGAHFRTPIRSLARFVQLLPHGGSKQRADRHAASHPSGHDAVGRRCGPDKNSHFFHRNHFERLAAEHKRLSGLEARHEGFFDAPELRTVHELHLQRAISRDRADVQPVLQEDGRVGGKPSACFVLHQLLEPRIGTQRFSADGDEAQGPFPFLPG